MPVTAPVVATCLFLTASASADELSPGQGDAGQISVINPGVSELSLENIFVVGLDKRGDASDFHAFLLTGPTFRYFIARNGVLGFNVSFLHRVAEGQAPSSSLGGALNVHVGYMLSLANGMFLKPLIGIGAFYAQRSVPVTAAGTEVTATAPSFGAIGRAGLDIVFYSSARFNLFAGPEMFLSLGSSTGTQVEGVKVDGEDFMSLDGGFNFGLSYVF